MKKLSLSFLALLLLFVQTEALEDKTPQNPWGKVILVEPFPDLKNETFLDFEMPVDYPGSLAPPKKSDEEIILDKAFLLEPKLNEKIFGQERAIKETSEAIIRFAAGVNDPNCPVASLLYAGPSGVGKTELAKQLCQELYENPNRLVRINMSEYAEPHSISRLIGAPPGYLGFGDGGQLTNALAKTPYSVVLLDEIEKAHPIVLKLFLQLLDEGFITSSTGKVVDCRKSIFILTSNLAAIEIADLHAKGLEHSEIVELLKPYYMQQLSPELFNRLDIILFGPLSDKVLESLIHKMLTQLADRVNGTKKILLEFDESITYHFMGYCLDPKQGARPLKRLIEKELATVVARAIIKGKCIKGDVLKCYYCDGCVVVEKVNQPTKSS